MDKLRIRSSMGLNGEINISGSKNAALPIVCSALLTNDQLTLKNIPNLKDISTLSRLLGLMGVKITFNDNLMTIQANNVTSCTAPYELVKQMRASILVLGPLLARFGEAVVSLPGGCAIGARPVDIHLHGLKQMGADIKIKHGYIKAQSDRLKGARIVMDVVTVTGTENLLMAATLANGTTILENSAIEPEVTNLAECLVSMGADIEGIGTKKLVIHGVEKLNGCEHKIIPDRIEAGTYAVAAVMTQGNIKLNNAKFEIMSAIFDKLNLAGAIVDYDSNTINISMRSKAKCVDITTSPYPGFPTDMQAQLMVLNSVAIGASTISESVFENRFMHVPELSRMGANIDIEGNVAVVHGVDSLTGANVMATDLRASASLVLAGLVAKGETILDRVYHLDRGYEQVEHKLSMVGADIVRVKY